MVGDAVTPNLQALLDGMTDLGKDNPYHQQCALAGMYQFRICV
jgi:hypothetical protein